MKKGFLFASVVALAAILTSCGAPVSPEQINVNPSPLAVVGNKVNAEITGTFPAKKFARKATLVVTPVLKFDGQEVLGESMTYVGEKVKDNGKTVSYAAGGTYTQSASFDFVPAMAKSELYLRFEAKKGNKVVVIPDVKVADGVITTPKLVNAKDAKRQVTADKFQRVIQEIQEADILFLLQQSNLRSSETKNEDVKNLQAAIKEANNNEKKAINNLEVSGYASPDGGMDLNTKLANARQANAQRFLQKQLKKDKVNATIDAKTTAEDWEGFQKAMEESNIQDKQLVLRVLSMYSDPEEREAQIKNLSSVYKTIADEVLPALRRSRMILTTDIIGKSDEEITALFKNDPAQLNIEEMLYAATLTNNNSEKQAIYKKATEMFGTDYRTWNNLGLTYFEQDNVAEARRCYQKALNIEPNNADVNYNAGVAALADGDIKQAETYLGKAAGTQGDLATAQGTLYTMKGDYKNAKTAYKQSATNNAAVQQILNEDYAGARKTLASVAEPNATTAYLSAIVGARTNDRDAVYTNLKAAVAQDASMKARAQKDIEFAKYMEDETFLAIVK
ncbi:MAG: tetratricopeptide repeat protein [Paludibacteraceae bacterium]|nr:tetratricopeptide repeat protein [Paludibacteraceae bacterium]